MTNVPFLAATTLLLLSVSSRAAHAQATLFTNRTTFLAALGSGYTNINFDNAVTSGTITDYSTAAGLTLSGVNFTGKLAAGGYQLSALRPDYYATYGGWNGNPSVLAGPSGTGNPTYSGALTITLPAGITAVGTDLYTVAQGDADANTVSPVQFTLSTGQTFSITTFGKPTLAFAGFTSTVPITSITVQAPTGAATFPDLSSFVFGHTGSGSAAAPEPGSIALLGSCLLPLAGLIARRRRGEKVSATA
jgi:hypothetical protein